MNYVSALLELLVLVILFQVSSAPPPKKKDTKVTAPTKKPSLGPGHLVIFDGIGNICSCPAVPSLHLDRPRFLSDLKVKLEEKMASSQNEVVSLLQDQAVNSKISYSQNRMTNTKYIRNIDADLRKRISENSTVREVIYESMGVLQTTMDMSGGRRKAFGQEKVIGEPRENLKMMKVPEAWELLSGPKGGDITVGIIGPNSFHYNHEVLQDSWLGQYGWYEPANLRPKPDEENDNHRNHGCYVAALITGANATGIAPDAKWMACRLDFEPGWSRGNFEDLLKCVQFTLCPTLADGSNPDCSRAPNIIYNLWRITKPFYDFEGPFARTIDTVLDCWHHAGIIPVFDNVVGNKQNPAKCGVGAWPSHSSRVISVAGVNFKVQITKYSPRGPSKEGDIKRDICAPDSMPIDPTGSEDEKILMTTASSVAGAHVVGAITLLLGKHKELTFAQVKQMVYQSTDKVQQNFTTDIKLWEHYC